MSLQQCCQVNCGIHCEIEIAGGRGIALWVTCLASWRRASCCDGEVYESEFWIVCVVEFLIVSVHLWSVTDFLIFRPAAQ